MKIELVSKGYSKSSVFNFLFLEFRFQFYVAKSIKGKKSRNSIQTCLHRNEFTFTLLGQFTLEIHMALLALVRSTSVLKLKLPQLQTIVSFARIRHIPQLKTETIMTTLVSSQLGMRGSEIMPSIDNEESPIRVQREQSFELYRGEQAHNSKYQ